MAKNIRRILALVLVMVMFASALPMQALAAEPVHTTETSPENLITDVYTTYDEDGNETIVVKITKGEYTDENGNVITVDREETIDKTGNAPVSSGEETKEWTEDVQPGEDFSVNGDVVVKAEEYETDAEGNLILDEAGNPIPVKDENGKFQISGSVTGTPETTTNGNTTTTTTDERVVTGSVTITGEDFVIDGNNSDLYCPVGPEDYAGKEYYDGSAGKQVCTGDGTCNTKCVHYREGLQTGYGRDYYENPAFKFEDGTPAVDDKPTEDGYDEGYDMVWSGTGDLTKQAAALVVKELVYLTDENGEIVYENGYPVVDMEKSVFVKGLQGKAQEGLVLSAGQFALKHENGEYFYAYCMDASTGASPEYNKWYNIRNLEDAIESEENPDGYLTEEEAGKIRAIATNGYWGTAEGQGSVDSLKEMLSAAYADKDGTESAIKLRYPGSNDVAKEYTVDELVALFDGLTESEALVVTQAAIWALANKEDVTYNQGSNGGLVTNGSVIGVLSAASTHNGKVVSSFLNEFRPEKDFESDARMQALYQVLLGLDPIEASDTATDVIPSEDVITDVGLVIHDKSEDKAENEDDNADNDVYDADVTFSLAFVPDAENDSLLVYLIEGYDEEGNPIVATDKDGKAIVRRLAGTNSEEDNANGIESIEAVDGVYTLTGLQLGENAEHTYDIRLEGTQYLENGVYIYQAHGGRHESQTLVGLANGSQTVTSTTSLSLTFEVDEKRNVVATRVWTDDGEPEVPEETPEEPEEEEDPPQEFRLDPETEEEIPEEPVPLAAPVVTGNNSFLWGLVVMMAVLGMAVINLTSKKNYAA